MPTIQEINNAIIFGDFTVDQLNGIIQAIKMKREAINKTAIRKLRVGDTVSFVNKRGSTSVGMVVDIKIKTAHVLIGNTTWRVPANMLTIKDKVPQE